MQKTAIIRRLPEKDRDPKKPAADQVWGLYSHKGDLLGRHPTHESAEAQERAIQIQKAREKGHNIPKKSKLLAAAQGLRALASPDADD